MSACSLSTRNGTVYAYNELLIRITGGLKGTYDSRECIIPPGAEHRQEIYNHSEGELNAVIKRLPKTLLSLDINESSPVADISGVTTAAT